MEHSQFADFFFICCNNSKCYIYSGGRFLRRSLEAVIFCFLVSFSAVYSSFDIQSYFKLVNKFIQQIWVSFLFSSKYDEGIHDNIHFRSVFCSIHGCTYGERYMTSSSRLFKPEDISQIFPDIG